VVKDIRKASLQQRRNIGDSMKQLIEILLVTFPVIALGADVQPALIGPVLKLV
jgi:hypothetical protein